MIIDAHHHFWQLSRGDYPWPNDSVAPIFRDFGPGDLTPLLNEAGVTKTVLVQATDTVAESEFLLTLASHHPMIAGVVGWVDLSAPDACDVIDQVRGNPLLKGLRPMLQNIDDTDWILRPEVQPALSHMAALDLAFDALIQPRHLPVIAALADRHPNLRIVIDHLAKPQMGQGRLPVPDWHQGMADLAARPNVWCKLSGMVTEAGPDWQPADLQPFAQHVLSIFAPGRIMFGSDWPVVNLASDYASWIQFVRSAIAAFSDQEQAQIMGGTAAAFYRL